MPLERRFKPTEDIQTRDFSQEMVWLNTQEGRLHRGNPTTAIIYKAAAEGKTEKEIITLISSQFEGDAEQMAKETKEMLELLVSEGLLQEIEEDN